MSCSANAGSGARPCRRRVTTPIGLAAVCCRGSSASASRTRSAASASSASMRCAGFRSGRAATTSRPRCWSSSSRRRARITTVPVTAVYAGRAKQIAAGARHDPHLLPGCLLSLHRAPLIVVPRRWTLHGLNNGLIFTGDVSRRPHAAAGRLVCDRTRRHLAGLAMDDQHARGDRRQPRSALSGREPRVTGAARPGHAPELRARRDRFSARVGNLRAGIPANSSTSSTNTGRCSRASLRGTGDRPHHRALRELGSRQPVDSKRARSAPHDCRDGGGGPDRQPDPAGDPREARRGNDRGPAVARHGAADSPVPGGQPHRRHARRSALRQGPRGGQRCSDERPGSSARRC